MIDLHAVTLGSVDLHALSWVSHGQLVECPIPSFSRVFVVYACGKLEALLTSYEETLILAERIGKQRSLPVIDFMLETMPVHERVGTDMHDHPSRGDAPPGL
ncbi:hypothetical protein [Ochrobactrum sp. MYb379]|uniref:hypothetical protein n=1 Tax=Ochrobactrum sp. MYb379 TaxID=2745275 RepID=UPI0030A1AC3D